MDPRHCRSLVPVQPGEYLQAHCPLHHPQVELFRQDQGLHHGSEPVADSKLALREVDGCGQGPGLDLNSRYQQGKTQESLIQLLELRPTPSNFRMYEPECFSVHFQPVISAVNQSWNVKPLFQLRHRLAAQHANKQPVEPGELLENRPRLGLQACGVAQGARRGKR